MEDCFPHKIGRKALKFPKKIGKSTIKFPKKIGKIFGSSSEKV
jgi:hypothetical protein